MLIVVICFPFFSAISIELKDILYVRDTVHNLLIATSLFFPSVIQPMSFESAKNCRLIAIHRNDNCARNHDRIADFSRLFQRFLR